jgi:glucose-1-phosphate adenylyltransferase
MDRNAPLARHAMAYVLAGGRGSRLMELTDIRAKPAVYFGGTSRIIDFALSNALNSGIRRISVATQYKAHSLIRHLQRGWNFFRPERNESFDILPASQRVTETGWYAGTADAVFQNIDIIEGYAPRYIVLLAGDHVYKMDYEPMLQQHVAQGADVTVGCIEVARDEAGSFGIMDIDANDRILSFLEKPENPPDMPDKPGYCLASMGIYVFETSFLIGMLRQDAANERSTRDVGTVDAYWKANIDLTDFVPGLDLYDQNWPIWTYGEIVPPSKFIHDETGRRGLAISSMVSGGCIVSGTEVRQSLLFTGVHTHSYGGIEQAVLLPYVQVGRHARLRRVVVDRGVVIPDGLVVGEDPKRDAARFRRSPGGICLITQPMIDRLPA